MKDRGEMTSLTSVSDQPPHLPSFQLAQPQPPHHDHRHNKKSAGGEEVWKDLPTTRGADINLLANSLSTRLRKTARQRVAASSAGTATITSTIATNTSSKGSKSAPPEESDRQRNKSFSKRASHPQVRPSILKRSLSREEVVEQQCKQLLEDSGQSVDPRDDFHLPDVFMDSRLSASAGQVDRLGVDDKVFNNQLLDRPAPALALLGGGGGGGGGGGYRTSSGQVMWVKRAGIFQPLDKYAPGRQNLFGQDQPYARSQTVDYETVTLSSRAGSPDSDVTSGWSSSKSQRKKGLKVSWKQPAVSEGQLPEGSDSRCGDTASSMRQRSAGTAHSEAGSFSYVKPKFNPGKSRVPAVGLKWKVLTPKVGKAMANGGVDDEMGRPFSVESSGHSSPASTYSHSRPPSPHTFSPSKPTSHTRDTRHPWRALIPRDVHPVTTAMEREGTSVSKTKWRVPSLRRLPVYTFTDDLMDSRHHQWHPANQQARYPTRATVDAQSMQNRLKEGVTSSSDVTTNSVTASNVTDSDLQASEYS